MTTTPTPTIYRVVHVVTIEGGRAVDDLLVGVWNGATLRYYAEGVRARGGRPIAVGDRDTYGRRVYAPTPELDRLYGLPTDPAEAAGERAERRIVCFHRRITAGTITYSDTTSDDPAVVRAATLSTLALHRANFFTNVDELALWDRLGLTPDGQLRDHPLLPADAARELRRLVDEQLRDLPLGLAAPAVEGLWAELAEKAGIDTEAVAA